MFNYEKESLILDEVVNALNSSVYFRSSQIVHFHGKGRPSQASRCSGQGSGQTTNQRGTNRRAGENSVPKTVDPSHKGQPEVIGTRNQSSETENSPKKVCFDPKAKKEFCKKSLQSSSLLKVQIKIHPLQQ